MGFSNDGPFLGRMKFARSHNVDHVSIHEKWSASSYSVNPEDHGSSGHFTDTGRVEAQEGLRVHGWDTGRTGLAMTVRSRESVIRVVPDV